ncbi:MAG: CBASS cGAMP-activated phospholipase [Gammaproteobacteria bacterium]|nr:CBASS cGAMP-activated phospholipase [Gammaproteobacteria bacterium]MDD9815921.1 CBASS cGAMP-activated phospholipase [Gammaproteobacteria bacterium]MDD9870843.1 CBASS cGAMP-activated phospholipase [Gammaproteobacteria bacterium]
MDTQFQILALSGGGFRGLYTATVLAGLEKEAGKPIAQCFDLICGTSIGGMIALALGLEKPAEEIASTIEKRGPEIFPNRKKSWIRRFSKIRHYLMAEYSNAPLKRVADELYGDNTLRHSRHRLIIPTVNYSTGKPQFFKTPHHETFRTDHRRKMSDVALATSAAPIFFPVYQSKDANSCYVDGGLVGIAPGMFGVHEATHFCRRDIANINLLSIGTMGGEFRMDSSKTLNKGVFRWGKNIFLLTISSQEKVTEYMLRHQLGERYSLIDELPTHEQAPNIGLDIADKSAIQTLKSMGEESAKAFVGKPEAGVFLSHSAPSYQPCYLKEVNNHE